VWMINKHGVNAHLISTYEELSEIEDLLLPLMKRSSCDQRRAVAKLVGSVLWILPLLNQFSECECKSNAAQDQGDDTFTLTSKVTDQGAGQVDRFTVQDNVTIKEVDGGEGDMAKGYVIIISTFHSKISPNFSPQIFPTKFQADQGVRQLRKDLKTMLKLYREDATTEEEWQNAYGSFVEKPKRKK